MVHPVVTCAGCGLQLTNPQPSDAELAAIYGPNYVLVEGDAAAEAMVREFPREQDHKIALPEWVSGDVQDVDELVVKALAQSSGVDASAAWLEPLSSRA